MLLCMCVCQCGGGVHVCPWRSEVNCKCPSLRNVYLVFPANFYHWPGAYQGGQAVWSSDLGTPASLSSTGITDSYCHIQLSTKHFGVFTFRLSLRPALLVPEQQAVWHLTWTVVCLELLQTGCHRPFNRKQKHTQLTSQVGSLATEGRRIMALSNGVWYNQQSLRLT